MILSIVSIAVSIALTFGLVIFFHELGHFIMCKVMGVRVERFSFGFGWELFGFTRGGTRFSVSAIPLGGYLKPAGEDISEHTGDPGEYFSKSWLQRLGIVAAGPAMNYVLAWVIFSGGMFFIGEPRPALTPEIAETVSGFPAEQAGLRPMDRIVEVDGIEVSTWRGMAHLIHARGGKKIKIVYQREGERKGVMIAPVKDPATGRGLIGITAVVEYRRVPLLRASWLGLGQCYHWTAYTISTLASRIYRREKLDLAGPVGIVQMVTRAARSGIAEVIFLIGLISVAIGFFNLLPIPILDGGHAVLYLWEGVSRRKLTREIITRANSIGLALLLTILVFATYNDIARLRGGP